MKLGIASDHRGFETKQKMIKFLEEKGYDVIDYGTNSTDRVDYTKYGFILGEAVRDKQVDFGIAICGSAIGISVACNKVKGIRCGKVNTEEEAVHGRENDFINVIALSGSMPFDLNTKIVEAFLNSSENLVDPAYKTRVDQIIEYENRNN